MKFREEPHGKNRISTRKALSSFVPILFHNFFVNDCHLIFEHFDIMAIEKGIEIKGEVIIAKPSEKFQSVRRICLNFLDSYRFSDASLDNLFTTLTSFPSLDANGTEDNLCKRKLTYHMKKF